jgi:RNA polymerase sigma-70 factor (ECF subfamily)
MTQFDSMYRKYYLRVLRYFMRAFHVSQEDAEELTQETFMRFFRAMNEYRGEAEWAFLETTARRVGSNSIRNVKAVKRGPKPLSIDDPNTFGKREPHAKEGPETVERAQERKLLHDAIEQLSPAQRQCVHLWLEGFKYTEIARALRISLDAVRSRIRDARRALLEKLGGNVELPEDDE